MGAITHGRRSWFNSPGRLAGQMAAVVGASGILVISGQLPAWAATDPYSSNPYGYDVSYPQCPGNSVPTAPAGETYSFAIVGVGGGRPFTSNTCAAAEATAAIDGNISNLAFYFNTGYAGAYGRNIDSTCSDDVNQGNDDGVFNGVKGHTLSQDQNAWEIGCSEALYAQNNAPSTSTSTSMWWADVETGNSWSTNTSLNDFALDGLSFEMQQFGAAGGGGFYSYTSAWDKIAGSGFIPTPAENGNWLAFAGNFNTVSYFVVQDGTSGGADSDLGY